MAQLTPKERIPLLRQHDEGIPWTRIAEESALSHRTPPRHRTFHRTGQMTHSGKEDSKGARQSRVCSVGVPSTGRWDGQSLEVLDVLGQRLHR